MRPPRSVRALAWAIGCVGLATAATACGAPEVREDLAYDDRYDETKLDLYLPDPGDGSGPRPTVMMLHPGGWRFGGRYLLAPAATRLARSGYVVANVEYRLVPGVTFPAPVRDAWCALLYLRAHAGDFRVDPDRIAVLGYSAGGHSAAMLGVAPADPSLAPDCTAGPTSPPRAIVAGAPVLDMRAYGDTKLVTDYMGGTAAEKPDAYDLASPLRFVRPGLPPFLFVVGEWDLWVGPDDSQRMRDALQNVGVDARVLQIAGAGHLMSPTESGEYAFMNATETPEAWLAIEDFLARTIGKP